MSFRIGTLILAGILAVGSLGLGNPALADQRNGDRHSRHDDRRERVCEYCGTVRSISRINRHSRSNKGAVVLGALIGGALGNQVGKGDGRKAATVAGAVAGGVIANNSTKGRSRQVVYRVSVRMDTGRVYEFDQSDIRGLRIGRPVEIHRGQVYPAR